MNLARRGPETVPSLSAMADAACMSRYHFLRCFSEACGETPSQYVYRLRLEQSVSNLIFHTHKPIAEIADTAGFASSQSFANAFRKRFGISPRTFRQQNISFVSDFPRNQFQLSPVMASLGEVLRRSDQHFEVTIEHFPKTQMAYVRHRGAYYHHDASKMVCLNHLRDWALRHNIWHEDSQVIGLCPDNPAVTPPEFCDYDFGIAVPGDPPLEGHVCLQELPEMTLAKLTVPASTDLGRHAWRWLLSDWLPGSPFAKSGHDYLEFFPLSAHADAADEDECVTLAVPVAQI